MEKFSIDDFKQAMKSITVEIRKYTEVRSIYGIPRGGLVPAVYLSHLTGLPIVDKPVLEETIVVDDIADTGQTLKEFSGYLIATIHWHRQSVVMPDIWVHEKKDEWIVYPWEVVE